MVGQRSGSRLHEYHHRLGELRGRWCFPCEVTDTTNQQRRQERSYVAAACTSAGWIWSRPTSIRCTGSRSAKASMRFSKPPKHIVGLLPEVGSRGERKNNSVVAVENGADAVVSNGQVPLSALMGKTTVGMSTIGRARRFRKPSSAMLCSS